jgi:alkylation response protein AidB-like acyl-CoA dehydrogenase
VDLELTEEQRWLAESIGELLDRTEPPAVWRALVEFGAFDIGDDGLGAVELALIARATGERLAALPYADAAAVHYAVDLGGVAVVPCLSEPGQRYDPSAPAATIDGARVTGKKDTVPYAHAAERFAVPATDAGETVLALVAADAATVEAQPTLDPAVGAAQVHFERADVQQVAGDADSVATVAAAAGILASGEAVGAAASLLALARDYAAQRRQFGHTIGSFQAVRHILADMFVRLESSWSSVLYAAAALDEGSPDAPRTAAIAKAYAARATQEVAHGALQVFGGIAFTQEHQAHRFLRRIVVREQQYGDARHHERAIGRTLAERAARAAAAAPQSQPPTPTPVS